MVSLHCLTSFPCVHLQSSFKLICIFHFSFLYAFTLHNRRAMRFIYYVYVYDTFNQILFLEPMDGVLNVSYIMWLEVSIIIHNSIIICHIPSSATLIGVNDFFEKNCFELSTGTGLLKSFWFLEIVNFQFIPRLQSRVWTLVFEDCAVFVSCLLIRNDTLNSDLKTESVAEFFELWILNGINWIIIYI